MPKSPKPHMFLRLLRPTMTKELLKKKKQENYIIISQLAFKIEFYFLGNMGIWVDKRLLVDSYIALYTSF